MEDRYYLYLYPIIVFLLFFGTDKVLTKIFSNRNYLYYASMVGLILYLGSYQIDRLGAYYDQHKTDYRGAWKYLTAQAHKDDIVLCASFRPYELWKSSWSLTLCKSGKRVYGQNTDVKIYSIAEIAKLIDRIESGGSVGRVFVIVHRNVGVQYTELPSRITEPDAYIEKRLFGLWIFRSKQEVSPKIQELKMIPLKQ